MPALFDMGVGLGASKQPNAYCSESCQVTERWVGIASSWVVFAVVLADFEPKVVVVVEGGGMGVPVADFKGW